MHFNKTTCEQIKGLFQIIWVKKLSKYIINALISESTKSLRVNYAELMEKTLIPHLVLKLMILSFILINNQVGSTCLTLILTGLRKLILCTEYKDIIRSVKVTLTFITFAGWYMYTNQTHSTNTASLVSRTEISPGQVCVSLYYYVEDNSTTLIVSQKDSLNGKTSTLQEISSNGTPSWSEIRSNVTSSAIWRVSYYSLSFFSFFDLRTLYLSTLFCTSTL